MKISLFKKLSLIIVFIIAVYSDSNAQSTNDFESWTSAGIEYELNNKWEFEFEAQYRLKENSSVTDAYFGELTSTYSISKKFSLGLGLRYSRKNDNQGKIQGWENHIRFHIDAGFKHKIDDFGLKIRLRYQNKDELGIQDEFGNFSNHYIRLKTGINYKISKLNLTPSVSGEIFYNDRGNENGFNKYRYTVGATYKMGKIGKIGVFYRKEKQIATIDPLSVDILRLKYVYSFK